MFTRAVDCLAPLPIDTCVELIQGFQPSLDAPFRVQIDGSTFVMRFGGDSQMKLWTLGTLESDGTLTHVQAQIGIDRQQSNLKTVFGVSIVVWMMALLQGFSDTLELEAVFIVGGLFFVAFWLILGGGMIYSQHRLRNDLIRLLCRENRGRA